MSGPYLIPGTDVLRNKLNLLDADELERRINDFAIALGVRLFYAGPPVKTTLTGTSRFASVDRLQRLLALG